MNISISQKPPLRIKQDQYTKAKPGEKPKGRGILIQEQIKKLNIKQPMEEDKKQSTKSEQLKYGVRYLSIEGSRMNALRIIFQLHTVPHLIKAMQCGCDPSFKDQNPYDTATAAALLLSFEENMLVYKNSKNQQIEMKYMIQGGQLAVSFSLPSSITSVRQAMMIIKKSINKKLVSRAYKLLNDQNKEYKNKKTEIMDTVASRLNAAAQITIFGKIPNTQDNKKKIEALVGKIKSLVPNKIESGKSIQKQKQQDISAQQLYKSISLPPQIPIEFIAILAAAMQNSGMDFYIDSGNSYLFINKEFCTSTYINPLKQFINTRLRFMFNSEGKSADNQKKYSKLAELVHQQAAFVLDLHDSMPQISNLSGNVKKFMDYFNQFFLGK